MTVYHSANAAAAGAHGPAVFRILHVCQANQCRSPMAERITRHELAVRAPRYPECWEVASAGTDAADGVGMHPKAASALAAAGFDAGGFSSRRLTQAMVDNADLVLAATATERDLVIALVPSALPIAFTLREFARLAPATTVPGPMVAADAAASARVMVTRVRSMRGRVPFVKPGHDDIRDPLHTATPIARTVADIAAAVGTVVGSLVDGRVPSLS